MLNTTNVQGGAVSRVFGCTDLAGIESAAPFLAGDAPDGADLGTSRHRVYNFEVEEHHTYIAGGIRVHNTSILNFLNPQQLVGIVPGSLQDIDGNGSFDYVEIDNGLGGLAAQGGTIYKMETVDGQLVAKAYVTMADGQGRLVQVQFLQDENGQVIEGSQRQIVLTGAVFGEQVGRLLTPFITSAILGDDASVFDRFVGGTIIGTFVQNAFEFAGGAIHDQIASGGMQNGTLEDIASITFADFGDNLIENGIDNAQALLSQWIMGEVFEGLNTETFGGKLAYLLADQGVNYILDMTVHQLAVDVFGLNDSQLARWGLEAPDLNRLFSGDNLLNLVFKAAIGTILPDLESTEAQIGSSLISLAVNFLTGIGGIWGSVIGYVGGLILDLIFDEDPRAFTQIGYSEITGEFFVGATTSADGGNKAIARSAAQAYTDFINGLIDKAQSSSNNLSELAGSMNLVFGHFENNYRNGDGQDYGSLQAAVTARIVDTLQSLQLTDGDVKFATAIAYIAANSATKSAQEILNEFSMRVQVAADYQAYLENKEYYDALIAADQDSNFAAGWVTTFLLAREYGYAEDFNIVGDDRDGVHIASSGNDVIDARGGNDRIWAYGGDDTLLGGGGDDVLHGGSGDDVLRGQQGDDILYGGSGNNTLYGGDGIDQFYVGPQSSNAIHGGGGEDLVNFAGDFADYTVQDLGNNQVRVTNIETGAVNNLYGVEFLRFRDTVRTFDPSYDTFITGTAGDDLLNGTDLRDAINGLAGDDIIYGFDGDDFLSGDAGDDQIFGGLGNDWIFGVLGNDILYGNAGDDRLDGGADGDYLWGNSGNDTLDGAGGGDVLNGGDGADIVRGGDGDDLLEGGAGDDTLNGGQGDDDLFGGDNRDVLNGGGGDDELHGGNVGDTLRGGWGDDVLYGDQGWDTLNGEGGDDIIHGGGGNDRIFGGWGDDTVYAGDGDDKIFALIGADPSTPFTPGSGSGQGAIDYYNDWGAELVYAGAGNDQVMITGPDIAFGESGDDTFYISTNQFRIDGGSGNDRMIFLHTNFIDVIWYKSTSGEIGGKVWENKAAWQNGGVYNENIHKSPYKWSYIRDIEAVQTVNGKVLNEGYSYFNGLGNAKYLNPSFTGFIDLTDAEFEARFSESAFLERQFKQLVGNWEENPPSTGWEQFGDGNDNITTEANSTYNVSGAQRIMAGGGNDTISVGSGNDQVQGQGGGDNIRGGSGNDILDGGDGWDTIYGESGADEILGGSGWDKLYGGSGDDRIWGSWGEDLIKGGDGDDILYGEQHNDEIHGEGGRDFISGGDGPDKLYGGDAPDVIQGNNGKDLIHGGDGGDDLDGGNQDDTIYGGLGIDSIRGGEGNDKLYGEDGSDEIRGDAGNDILAGGNASDNLFGGSGNDTLSGDSGDDDLRGEAGDDFLTGGAGADRLDGGAGTDVAGFVAATAGVGVDLLRGRGTAGEALNDLYIDIENVQGSDFGDEITGSDGVNNLSGNLGDDVLSGMGGDDTLLGGGGNDAIDGGEGNDLVDGGGGDDRLAGGGGDDDLRGMAGNDTLEGGDGNDDLAGGAGDDELAGGAGGDMLAGEAGNDTLRGEAGADILSGGDGDDVLSGGDGDDDLSGGNNSDYLSGGYGADTLRGEAGQDILFGNAGGDVLIGGAGDDILVGGAGDDTLTGGAGRDGFGTGYGQGHDTIEDFAPGSDKISLSAGTYRVVIFDEAGGARVQIGPDASLLVRGISASQLSEADFAVPAGSSLTIVQGIIGSNGSETLNGTAGTDIIFAREGNDTLRSNGGDDALYGGAGKDKFYGGDGRSAMYGGDGKDYFYAGTGAEMFYGGAGNDSVYYSASAVAVNVDLDTGRGSAGLAQDDQLIDIEYVIGSAYDDRLSGDRDANRFYGQNGEDLIYGRGGNDLLYGQNGSDKIFGGAGNDIIEGGRGGDRLIGGEGKDRLQYRSSDQGVTVNLQTGAASGGHAEGDVFSGFEDLYGSNNDALSDKLIGNDNANRIWGARGDDYIRGGRGDDSLFGGAGSDVFAFRNGDGNDTIFDFASAEDQIRLVTDISGYSLTAVSNGTSITYTGGQVLVRDATVAEVQAAIVEPARINGTAGDDTLNGTAQSEIISGLEGRDVLYSNGGEDALFGGGGTDKLYGGAGDASLYGGDDRDYIYASSGAEYIDGGAGYDYVYYSASASAVIVNLHAGKGSGGDAEGDSYVSVEYVVGSGLDDRLTGDASANRLFGQNGSDVLLGGAGADRLYGGGGDDTLYGGEGNDQLFGNAGADTIYGGAGVDRLSYHKAAAGVIVNLKSGEARGGDAEGDVFYDIEDLQGGYGNDTLTGDSGANTIWGNRGDDTIRGFKGNDQLFGNAGADVFVFYNGEGNDTIKDFEDGVDLIRLAGKSWSDLTITADGNNTLVTHDGAGMITLQGIATGLIGEDDFLFS